MRGSEIEARGAKGPEIKGPREQLWLIKFYERFIQQRNDVDDFQDWTMFECEHEAGCKNAIHKFHLPVAPEQWFCSAHSDVPLNTPPRRKKKKPRVESPQPASAAAAAGSSESIAEAAPHVISPTLDSPDVSLAAAESSESAADAAPHVISPTLDSPDVSLAESDGAPVHEPDPADAGFQPMDTGSDAEPEAGAGAQNYDPDLVDLSSASSQPEEDRVYAEISSDDEPAAAAAAAKASSSKKKKNKYPKLSKGGPWVQKDAGRKAREAAKRRKAAAAAAAAAEAREWWHREQRDGDAADAAAEAAPATASASAAPLLSTGFAPAMTRELRNRDLSNAAAAAAPAAASASAAPLLSEEEIMARTNQYFLRIARGEVPEAAATPPAAAAAAAAANPDEETAMLNAMLNLSIQPKRPLTLRNVFDD